MKRLLLSICMLALFVPQLSAQPNMSKMLRSKAFREVQKEQQKKLWQSHWDGTGTDVMLMGLTQHPDTRAVWGVTDEQHGQIMSSMMSAFTDPNSEYMADAKEMGEMLQSGKVFGDNSDPESEQRYMELQTKMQEVAVEKMSAATLEVLTDEQKQMARELQLSTMSKSPFVSPEAFEVLGLSEEQKDKMNAIRKEMTPQFNEYLDKFSDGQAKISDKIFAALDKEGDETKTPADFAKKMQDIAKRLADEDPEFKKIAEEMETGGKAFAAQFKTKMFDVLTDEQWEKLQNLVDNPPEHVKKMQAAMKKFSGQDGETEAVRNPMDAWKPGDAIPEEYRQKRARKAFPVAE